MKGAGVCAAVAALTTAALMTAACGAGDDGAGPGPEVVVTPDDSLVPVRGGEDIPAVALAAVEECDRRLRAGEYEELAASADRSAGQGPQAAAVLRVCGGTAKVNAGQVEEGLADLNEAEAMSADLPEAVRGQMLALLYRAEVVGYAVTGQEAGVSEALGDLVRLEPERAEQYVGECESAKRSGSQVRCELSGTPEPAGTPDPSDTSGTPDPEESPTGSAEPEPSPDASGTGPTGPGPDPASPASPDGAETEPGSGESGSR
ncbi:hypothetical protein [Planobispora takensis]|uniref:Uncharacterized protein n=1 Tax=Planobispora takensis TaxID=1367882 RepID=A0A8J3SSB9_9ACTN|nr:hypothetical protein [Planobispora takensis]GIH99337.1 hypothetical protein Pta02_13460 [Planobispora takensis]